MPAASGDQSELKGARVRLRPLREADLPERLVMNNDPDVQIRTVGEKVGASRLSDLQDWWRTLSADSHGQLWAVETRDGVYIGDLDLHSIGLQPPGAPRHAWINPFFGRKEYWIPELEKEACSLLLDYARDVLHLQQVSMELLATEPLVPILRSLGFVQTECLTGGAGGIDVLTLTLDLRPPAGRQ